MRNRKRREKQSRLWKKEKDGSKELTDQQLVAKARTRARGLPLMVEDLFDAVGYFNNIFWLSLLLNSLLWGLGSLQYMTVYAVVDEIKDFKFEDMNKTVYTTRSHFENFELNELGKNSKEAVQQISRYTELFGPMYIWLRHRASLQRILLESCLFYTLACTFFYAEFSLLLRLGVIFTSFFSKPIRYVSFIHLTTSVPTRLLPFAMGIVFAGECVFNLLHHVFLLKMTVWRWNQLVLGFIMTLAGIVYYIFIPSPILLDLVQKKGANIESCIKRVTKSETDGIDVDALIDDTVFGGQATISPWKKAMTMLGNPSFRWKYIALLLLLGMEDWSLKSSKYAMYGALLDKFPLSLIQCVVEGFASLLSIVLLYQCGRRLTISFHILLTLGALAVLLSIRVEAFDICYFKNAPGTYGKVLSAITGVILFYSSRILKIAVRMVMIQHIPVEQHTILLPFAMVFVNGFREILVSIQEAEWAKWEDPAHWEGFNFALVLVFAPLLLLVDNCATMPLVSHDYMAYQSKGKEYQHYPQLNDNEDGEGTYEGTS